MITYFSTKFRTTHRIRTVRTQSENDILSARHCTLSDLERQTWMRDRRTVMDMMSHRRRRSGLEENLNGKPPRSDHADVRNFVGRALSSLLGFISCRDMFAPLRKPGSLARVKKLVLKFWVISWHFIRLLPWPRGVFYPFTSTSPSSCWTMCVSDLYVYFLYQLNLSSSSMGSLHPKASLPKHRKRLSTLRNASVSVPFHWRFAFF